MANSLTIASYRLLILYRVFTFAISQLLKNSLSNFSTTALRDETTICKQNQSRETDINNEISCFNFLQRA